MGKRLGWSRGVGIRRLIVAVLVLVLVVSASLGGYRSSRDTTNRTSFFGDFDSPDHVEATLWITKVDAAADTFSLTITDVRPYGSLADDNGNFAEDATLVTNALGTWRTQITRGDSAPDADQRIALDGSITDYPFDRYKASIEMHVDRADGTELPVAVIVFSTDPFFSVTPSQGAAQSGGTMVNLAIHRTLPTMVFAIFIMVLMLGLATAAVIAAYFVQSGRRGLNFTACSMMGALLFALIPLRNAVPGSPPIGSVIDFASFFIAEAIISISLISTVLNGYRHEMAVERAAAVPAEEVSPEPAEASASPTDQRLPSLP
ncbi:DUF4436 domain-containing protein [Mycolicibacterium komossense]|uniref:DUF4436 family protein n=1 Tax=Mycolicibacterium komossense TaxID=1779 RepID=A0ABT3CD62_9MYCO|nr:DUF4436 domain-containing protein [Mycolicibacterium komossense]MCV7227351.1 DUF4436 family protein [Mycolicibacterium komossense]